MQMGHINNIPETEIELQEWLTDHFGKKLGIDSKLIELGKPFASYGLSSVVAVEMTGEIGEKFGIELSPVLFYQYSNFLSLSKYLAKLMFKSEKKSIAPEIDMFSDPAEPIAIIGLSCRFPGSPDPETFWDTLITGKSAIRKVPEGRWPKMGLPEEWQTISHGGFLDNIEVFDPLFFGISPREAIYIDPQQRLLLEVSWEALENAGIPPDSLGGKATGVFVGISNNDYARLGTGEESNLCAWSGTGNALSIASNRISYFLDFKGPSLSIDTACSSSLVAVHQAIKSLRSGECDLALAGGVNILTYPTLSVVFSRAGMLAPDGLCKTFDSKANGYVRGEGAGIVVLKNLSKALADGDRIHALIRGSAMNHDGSSNGLTAPNGVAQAQVVKMALKNAGVNPRDIGYIECHGTGTSLGDPIEVEALVSVYDNKGQSRHPCYLGAVKTNIGHLESAAGIAGLIKTILILRHKKIPQNLNFNELNDKISLKSSNLRIASAPQPWNQPGNLPFYAGVSSFGFGGTNAHIILEAFQPESHGNKGMEKPLNLLKLSAKTGAGLRSLSQSYAHWLTKYQDPADLFYTANKGRSDFSHRLVLIAKDSEDAINQLRTFADNENPESLLSGQLVQNKVPKIAFLFTGQGSQYPQMGKELYETQPFFRNKLDYCDKIYHDLTGESLLEVLFSEKREPELIHQTEYSQPALFALEHSLDQLLKSWGIRPDIVMGHSLGEFSAACSSGLLSIEEGMRFVTQRGKLMAGLEEAGKMLVVFAPEKDVVEAIQKYQEKLSIAALNGSNHIVISGKKEAIMEISEEFKARKIRTRLLNASHAFHSQMMSPIIDDVNKLAKSIRFGIAEVPIISNLLAKPVKEQMKIPDYWVRQMMGPVRFNEGINVLEKQNIDIFVEIGPAPTLISLGKNCIGEGNHLWVPSLRQGQSDLSTLFHLLGQLYIKGVDIDWNGFEQGYSHQIVSAPTYPFQREKYWPGISEKGNSSHRPAMNYSAQSNEHPLLGQRLHSPAFSKAEIVYESLISANNPEFLTDHRIYQRAVLPASGYIELVLAAGREVLKSEGLYLREVRFLQAMLLPEGSEIPIQFILYPQNEKEFKFKIFSGTPDEINETQWSLHAAGIVSRLQNIPANREMFDLDDPEEINIEKHYQFYRSIGMEYGQSFQAIEQLWKQGNQVMGRIWLPGDPGNKASSYQFHPVLLDASMQIIAAVFHDIDGNDAFLPIGIEEFEFFRRPGNVLWSYATVKPREESDKDLLEANLDFYSEDGNIVASMRRLTLKRTRKIVLEQDLKESIQKLLYQEEWKVIESFSTQKLNSLPKGSWWIFTHPSDRNLKDFCNALEQNETEYMIIQPGKVFRQSDTVNLEVDPSDPSHFQAIPEHSSFVPDNILFMWGLDFEEREELGPIELEKFSETVYLPLLRLVRQVGLVQHPKTRPSFWVLTRGAVSAGENSEISGLTGSPLWGMFKSFNLEINAFKGTIIDLDPNETRPPYLDILSTCIASEPERELAVRADKILIPRLIQAPLIAGTTLKIKEDATYLITGGMGFLGLQISQWLVDQGARYIILCGRNAARESAVKMIGNLRSKGATIATASVDVTNLEDLKALFVPQKDWPEVKGVIHAAGLIGFDLLDNMKEGDFASVLRPKVAGAWCLHLATKELDLDFFCAFSSISSVWGSKGQIHYAAANSFLDALTRYRTKSGLVSQTINWGPWTGGGMLNEEDKEKLKILGIHPLLPELATRIFGRLLGSDLQQIIAAQIDWFHFLEIFQMAGASRRFELIPTPDKSKIEEKTMNLELIKRLASADSTSQYDLVLSYLKKTIGSVLKINSSDVNIHQSLIPMGMDSFMALEIKNKIEVGLGIEVETVMFLQDLTVDQLSHELVSKLDITPRGETEEAPAIKKENETIFRFNSSMVIHPARAAKLLGNIDRYNEDEIKDLMVTLISEDY
jgi:acyl transferase domain-containing protein/acyl carrier protein